MTRNRGDTDRDRFRGCRAGPVILPVVEVNPDLVDFVPLGPSVELPFFCGPLDLLLHLIRKNEVSIYDIPILSICDQYHEHIRAMQELDLEVAGEFLWMAAWLLQLKSKMLLPRTETEEGDPREELVERLLAGDRPAFDAFSPRQEHTSPPFFCHQFFCQYYLTSFSATHFLRNRPIPPVVRDER